MDDRSKDKLGGQQRIAAAHGSNCPKRRTVKRPNETGVAQSDTTSQLVIKPSSGRGSIEPALPAPDSRVLSDIAVEVLADLMVHGHTPHDQKLLVSGPDGKLVRTPLSGLSRSQLTFLSGKLYPALTAEAFEELNQEILLRARLRSISPANILGPGIHALGKMIIIVNGGRSIIRHPDGRFEASDQPVINDHLIDAEKSDPFADHDGLFGRLSGRILMDPRQVFERVRDILAANRYQHPNDLIALVSTIFLLPIAACLPFRFWLWITGPTNTGKTTTCLVIGVLVPGARMLGADTSAAGLRQIAEYLPILIDEFEKSPHQRRILDNARSSTNHGGQTAKGSGIGRAKIYTNSRLIVFSSIGLGCEDQADWNRTKQILLLPGGSLRVPLAEEVESLRLDVLACSVQLLQPICDRFRELMAVPYEGDYRRVQCHAMIVAAWSVFMGVDLEQAVAKVNDMLAEDRQQDHTPDEQRLLADILGSRISASDNAGKVTVNRVADALEHGQEIRQHLVRYGLRCMDNGLFIANNEVRRFLLGGSIWAGRNIGSVLRHLPGAKSSRARLIGPGARGDFAPSVRGVVIPYATIRQFSSLGPADAVPSVPPVPPFQKHTEATMGSVLEPDCSTEVQA